MKIKRVSNQKALERLGRKSFFEGQRLIVDLTSYYWNIIPDNSFKNNEYVDTVICLPTLSIAGKEAFNHCEALRTVDGTLSAVLDSAFAFCPNLKRFNFKDVVLIGPQAFQNSGLEDVRLHDIQVVSAGAFNWCIDLKTLSLGKTINIGPNAFTGCSFPKLVVPETVKTIGAAAFSENIFLTDVIFAGDQVPDIDKTAFDKCAIRNVWILSQAYIEDYKDKLPKTLSDKIFNIKSPKDFLQVL